MSAPTRLQQAIARATAHTGGPRVRVRARAVQKPPGQMNGLESRYAQHLELRLRAGEIASWRYEAIRLKLGEGAWFCPDFQVQKPDGTLEFHETKGHMREAANVRLKVAAHLYPEFRFLLVRQSGTKQSPIWSSVEVSP